MNESEIVGNVISFRASVANGELVNSDVNMDQETEADNEDAHPLLPMKTILDRSVNS
jgi:hypothetical protein